MKWLRSIDLSEGQVRDTRIDGIDDAPPLMSVFESLLFALAR